MRKKFITTVLLALVPFGAGSINHAHFSIQDTKTDTFIVGVFRPDGVIVPFAQYSNREWTNPWHNPEPKEQAAEPDTIADLSKPWYETLVKPAAEWYLLLSSGDPRAVGTTKSVQVCSHCQQVWGLPTDYPDSKQPEKNECVRNLGIALSEKKDPRAMEQLTNASADWGQLMTFIRPEFEHSESAAVARELELSQPYSRQLPPAEERAKVPLSILHLYRNQLSENSQILFFFEASKEYPKPREAHDAGCNYISLSSGWVLRDSQGKLTLLDSGFGLTDCDMKEGGMTLPFALLRLDGKTFAIVEEDSYEGESYIIFEIRKDKVHRVLETYAGSC